MIILAPSFRSSGGVSTYVQALRGNWSVAEQYFFRGSGKSGKLMRPLMMLKEYFTFFIKCFSANKTILVNTSMDKKAHRRDSIFILIAFLFRKKIFVFIHGWDQAYFASRKQRQLALLFKARKLFVLSNDFKQELLRSGYKGNVIVETTVVENEFMDNFPAPKRLTGPGIRFLYLARLEKEKGILLAMEAFQQLAAQYNNVHLDIAGFGSLEKEVRAALAATASSQITYHGLVKGSRKAELFRQANVYLLPTSHGEGMPISVLEAMAAGLAVITTSAGALNDFFRDGEMGYKMATADKESLFRKMEDAVKPGNKLQDIGAFNHAFARDHFTVAKVISRLEKEILSL
jgi:glycosyltransferase involved in cell wall biosynthesis